MAQRLDLAQGPLADIINAGALVSDGAFVVADNSMRFNFTARKDGNRGISSGDGFNSNSKVWLKTIGSFADQDDHKGVTGFDKSRRLGAG